MALWKPENGAWVGLYNHLRRRRKNGEQDAKAMARRLKRI